MRPERRDDGWKTRADIMYDTDAERLCRITLKLVEAMGASVSLTNAVMHLDAARNCIADHVEGKSAAVTGHPTDEPPTAGCRYDKHGACPPGTPGCDCWTPGVDRPTGPAGRLIPQRDPFEKGDHGVPVDDPPEAGQPDGDNALDGLMRHVGIPRPPGKHYVAGDQEG